MRHRLLIVIAALSVCSLLACVPALPVNPTKLKVVMLPFITFAPFFIAQEEGFFGEQGLEVEFVRMARTAEAIPALARGEVDVASGSITVGLFNAISKNADLRLVADKGYFSSQGCTVTALVARRQLVESGALGGAAQLKGRKVSATSANFEEYYLDTFLGSAGLSVDDVDRVDLDDPALVGALEQGAIDVVSTSEPQLTRVLDSGQGVVWRNAQELAPDFHYSGLMYGPNLLHKDTRAGERFMTAYLKGVRQYLLGATERNLDIVAKYTQLDRQLLSRVCWAPVRADGRIDSKSVVDFQSWAVKRGLLEGAVPEERFWEPHFIQTANRALGSPS